MRITKLLSRPFVWLGSLFFLAFLPKPEFANERKSATKEEVPFSESEWQFAQDKALELYGALPKSDQPVIFGHGREFSPAEMIAEIEASTRIGEDHIEIFADDIRDDGFDPEIDSRFGLKYLQYPPPAPDEKPLNFLRLHRKMSLEDLRRNLEQEGFEIAFLTKERFDSLTKWCERFGFQFRKVIARKEPNLVGDDPPLFGMTNSYGEVSIFIEPKR